MSRYTPRTSRAPLAVLSTLMLLPAGPKLFTDALVRRAEARYAPTGEFVGVSDLQLHYVAKWAGDPVVMITAMEVQPKIG